MSSESSRPVVLRHAGWHRSTVTIRCFGLSATAANAAQWSICQTKQDRERLHGLIAASDVVIDSAEPETHADPGLDAEALYARHPHLIVASITAYGRTGPWAGRDVPNAVVDATGGMAFKAGTHEGGPILPPGNIADDTASFTTVHSGSCAPCGSVQNTGAGQVIDASVNECVAQTTDWSLSNWSRSADAGEPSSERRAGPGVVYTIIPCADGFVRLIVLSPRQWHCDPFLDGGA